jgi:hypothetical protein
MPGIFGFTAGLLYGAPKAPPPPGTDRIPMVVRPINDDVLATVPAEVNVIGQGDGP